MVGISILLGILADLLEFSAGILKGLEKILVNTVLDTEVSVEWLVTSFLILSGKWRLGIGALLLGVIWRRVSSVEL